MCKVLEDLKKSNLNKFQKNKLVFLEDMNYEENTFLKYWSTLAGDNIINLLELSKDKDLYEFSTDEIIDMLSSYPTASSRSLIQTLSICNRYSEYAIQRGWNHTGINNFDIVSLKDDVKLNKLYLKNTYQTLDEFYSFLNGLTKSSDVDKCILLLLRYGVGVKEAIKVRYEDIEGNILTIHNEDDSLKYYPIDGRFVELINKSKECVEFGNVNYIDTGYVIKATKKSRTLATSINQNSFRNRINNIAVDNEIVRPNINKLTRARRYDLLLNIYEDKGFVSNEDVDSIIGIFDSNPTLNKREVLKASFTDIFNIDVKTVYEAKKCEK